jgi:hypothetical protein
MEERLSWAKTAVRGLQLALGPEVVGLPVRLEETADPLAWILTLTLKQSISKGSRKPLRTYFRLWARVGDCHVPRIVITNQYVRAELLIKSRHKKDRFTEKRFGGHNDRPGPAPKKGSNNKS